MPGAKVGDIASKTRTEDHHSTETFAARQGLTSADLSRFYSCATRGSSPRAADCRLPLFTANHVRDCRGGAPAYARVLDRALPLARPPGHRGQNPIAVLCSVGGTFAFHTIGDCKCANTGYFLSPCRTGNFDEHAEPVRKGDPEQRLSTVVAVAACR